MTAWTSIQPGNSPPARSKYLTAGYLICHERTEERQTLSPSAACLTLSFSFLVRVIVSTTLQSVSLTFTEFDSFGS
ncbi:hypothetical protein KUCAC02_004103 [Chaenocephalus aceratus]|uniref:Uncharacterized protein n=1 Tax=Chaenocephalus aceratus TaxID=36190 RepID=A0ACB9WYI6_CHAAC|nr:hypothetical protein KUCAC02_004103 [Chaenocephalus aceratus]